MSKYFWPRSAAVRRRTIAWRSRAAVIMAALTLLIQGCTARPPQASQGPDAADPDTTVPASGYRSTIAPYRSQRPVEPATWRERNDRVAPAAKKDAQ